MRNDGGIVALLEEQVRELRAALEHTEEAICRLDGEGRVVSVNQACATLTGYDPADIAGRSWEALLAEPDRGRVRSDLQTAREKVERDVRGVRSDGSEFEMRLGVVPILDGRPAAPPALKGHYLYLRDLTDRRRMEKQLIFAGRMAAVGTLAAGVAHEINNPLAYIVANIDFSRQQMGAAAARLGDDDTGRMVEEVGDALGEARQGAERVRNIVRDLRVFARGDEESRGPVVLRRVLDSSINMAWNEIRHRARLVKDYGDVPVVDGNESRLGQVFLNLLLNAAHAIPEGEAERNEIRVRTRAQAPGRVVVEIRDTGRGISQENKARIFDPFFTTKAVGEGTGLGLWICQGILATLGGQIAVESEEGKGAVFRVTLPAAHIEASERGSEAASVEQEARGGRLLVVDDEPMILGALRRALAQHYQVTCVGDGRRALALICAGERYDAILCDLMMPELTGMDLFGEVRRLVPEQSERMIFVTGGAFTPRAREFLERVPNARVEKPIDFQTLRILIRNLLR